MNGPAPRRGGILREAFDYDFSRVDPAAGAHVDPPWCAIYETALIFDEYGRPGPMIVDRWSSEQDDLVWRLHIRSGARFHSGTACDARAVAAAFDIHRDPVASPVNQFFWAPVSDVSVDGGDVLIHLRHPYAGLPTLLRSWHSAIHDPGRRAAGGEAYGWEEASGTGPFRLGHWERGVSLQVDRWAGFPGTAVEWLANRGPAYLDGVRWVAILDERERAAALEAGEVDCAQNPSVLDVARLRQHPDLEVIVHQQSALAYLAVDHETRELGFHDVRVRRALSLALDRERLAREDLAGIGWPAHGPIPSHSLWYEPAVESAASCDPREAIRLLDAAGCMPDADGVRLRFPVLVLEDATLRRVAASVAGMLRAVGVLIDLRPVDGFATFYGRLGEHPPAFLSKWLWPDPVDAIIGFIDSRSHVGPNWQRASIPAIDAACDRWRHAPDADTQRQAASDIQRLSAEHLPLIPLYHPPAVWAHHRRVHGWRPLPTNLYPLYNDVWLEGPG